MKETEDTNGTKQEPPDQEALIKMWAEILHISPTLARELLQMDWDEWDKTLEDK